MKKTFVGFIVLILLLASCSGGSEISSESDSSMETPLFMTTMTHLEGIVPHEENEQVFLKYVEQMRWAMDMADEYGAKLTFESESSFLLANTKWNLNFMKEIVDSGHGVGSHADFGLNEKNWSYEDYVEAFKDLKKLLDDLVGSENNKGVSGGTGPFDWVEAAAEAGFEYRDALTGIAYLSMPISERPEGWSDDFIKETAYHDSIPPDLSERIYFFELADSKDLVPDEDGLIVISGGELGELASLEENRRNCGAQCVLSQEDVDVFFEQVEEIIRIKDVDRLAKINVHVPVRMFADSNEAILRSFFEGLKRYVDEGKIVWATQLEAYEAYEEI